MKRIGGPIRDSGWVGVPDAAYDQFKVAYTTMLMMLPRGLRADGPPD